MSNSIFRQIKNLYETGGKSVSFRTVLAPSDVTLEKENKIMIKVIINSEFILLNIKKEISNITQKVIKINF